MIEPWLRNTLTHLDPLRRQVLHALQLTAEDLDRFCSPLTPAQLDARPAGLAPVAFHLRHIARSLDRLLTYAEGRELTPLQLAALATELQPFPRPGIQHPLEELRQSLPLATARILAFLPATYDRPRFVGRDRLPTTVGALLIHCAEHTQRHTGQAITSARIATFLLDTENFVSSQQ